VPLFFNLSHCPQLPSLFSPELFFFLFFFPSSSHTNRLLTCVCVSVRVRFVECSWCRLRWWHTGRGGVLQGLAVDRWLLSGGTQGPLVSCHGHDARTATLVVHESDIAKERTGTGQDARCALGTAVRSVHEDQGTVDVHSQSRGASAVAQPGKRGAAGMAVPGQERVPARAIGCGQRRHCSPVYSPFHCRASRPPSHARNPPARVYLPHR